MDSRTGPRVVGEVAPTPHGNPQKENEAFEKKVFVYLSALSG